MKIAEIRRARLKLWFAKRTLPEKEKSYLSQLMGGKASFGEKAARRLEKTYEMPPMYLDQLPGSIPEVVQRAYAENKVWVIGNGQGGLPDRIWTDGDHPVGASDKYAEVATDDDHAFVVCVRGDSMIPRYQPGEYALVEPDTAPEIEDDVLVRLESGETMLKRLLSRRGGIRLGSYNSAEVMTYREDEITWIYYVSHPIPARKIKHWVKQQEYEGEERRHHADPRDPERRSGYVLPEPISSERPGRTGKYILPKPMTGSEHVYGTKQPPGKKRGAK